MVQWKLLLECRTQELASPVDKEISDMGYDGLSGRSLPILSITQVTGMRLGYIKNRYDFRKMTMFYYLKITQR